MLVCVSSMLIVRHSTFASNQPDTYKWRYINDLQVWYLREDAWPEPVAKADRSLPSTGWTEPTAIERGEKILNQLVEQ